MNNRHHTLSRLARRSLPLVATLFAVVAISRDAEAQVRLGGYAGLQRIGGNGASSMAFQFRGEGTFALIPWLHAGLYAEGLTGGDGGQTGWGVGGIAALRPALPGTSIDPMGYATLGYQRAPTGAVFNAGALFELGGGLSWHALPLIDIELRAGYVGLFGPDGMNGFSVAAGVSLHP